MNQSALPALAGRFVVAVSVVVASLFSFLPLGALAQDSGEEDRLTILITAARFAETVDEALAPVTVITRQDIEERQATTLEEALRAVPGITLSNSGGAGKLTSLFLRGTESNHVLVLIDGVKVGNATSGTTPFEHLPLDQVERIEVVRGPRSSLYGAEAIGGVIQIFTRRGHGEARPTLELGAGSHATRRVNAGVSGSHDRAWYHLGASKFKTSGFNACRGPTSAGCLTDEPDDDRHENKSLSVRGGVAVTDALSIEGNFLASDSETEYDGKSQNLSETVNRTTSAKANWRINAAWESSLQLSEHRDKSRNFVDCNVQVEPCNPNNSIGTVLFGTHYRSTFNTKREQASWQNNFRLNANNRMVAGVDYQDDTVDSSTDYDEDSRDNTGVFAAWRGNFNADDVEVSLREDDNEQFGEHTTGGVAWGRALGDGNRITASYGTAFAAPTFNDLYFPGFSNPNLKPEKSKSLDFGLARRAGSGGWSVNFFRTTIDDLISKAEITGLELSGDLKAGGWNISANLTLQKPQDASGGASNGNLLVRRPRQIIQLDAHRRFGRFSLGAALHNQDRSYDNAANTRVIDGFTVVDLRGEIRMHRDWTLGLKVGNLFDRKYETVAYYPQDRINFMATLRWRRRPADSS